MLDHIMTQVRKVASVGLRPLAPPSLTFVLYQESDDQLPPVNIPQKLAAIAETVKQDTLANFECVAKNFNDDVSAFRLKLKQHLLN